MAEMDRTGGGGGPHYQRLMKWIARIAGEIYAAANSPEAAAAGVNVCSIIAFTLLKNAKVWSGAHPLDFLAAIRTYIVDTHEGPLPEPVDQDLDDMIAQTVPAPGGRGRRAKLQRLLGRLLGRVHRRPDGWPGADAAGAGAALAAVQTEIEGGPEKAYATVVVTRPGKPGEAVVYHPGGRVETVPFPTPGGPPPGAPSLLN